MRKGKRAPKAAGTGERRQEGLGRFDAAKDTPYRLRVDGTANAALNAANPRIRVSIDPRRYKGAFAAAFFYAMIALALTCVGGAMLLQALVVAVYRKLRPDEEGD